MRIIGFLILFLLQFYIGNAQQRPQYTQYVYNNFLMNPAISGIENYTDVKLGFRNQWTGLEGAPQSAFVSAHWPIGGEYLNKTAMSFSEDGNDPMKRSYTREYRASPNHHGVGFTVVGDKIGPFSSLYVNATYAYHKEIGEQLNLSVGAAVGIVNIGFNPNSLVFENQNDPILNNFVTNQIKPDINLGTWLYSSDFFVGASVQNAVPFKVKISNSDTYAAQGKYVPHAFLTAGYRIYLQEDISVMPSFMIKYVNPAPLSFDINARISYQDKFWLGASYRKNDSMSAMMGVNISHLFNITYSYDFTTSALQKVSTGSHEIVMGVLLNNVYKTICPRNLW